MTNLKTPEDGREDRSKNVPDDGREHSWSDPTNQFYLRMDERKLRLHLRTSLRTSEDEPEDGPEDEPEDA
jgi:hypothetical protein